MAKVTHATLGLARSFEPVSDMRPVDEDEGQTVTEYAVVLSVVIIALAGVVFALQGQIESFIEKVATEIAAILP